MLRDWFDSVDNKEPLQVEALLLAVGLFLLSLYFSWKEVAFLTRGQTQDVVVEGVYQESTGRYRARKTIVQYSYVADGHTVQANTPLGLFDDKKGYRAGMPITIEFIGGQYPKSRIQGQHFWWALLVLGGSTLGLAGTGLRLFLASRKPQKRGYVAGLEP